MTGFSDPIVGGIGKLIRQYIQSPNYVAGVSGWTINKDGSAEFNNVVIRGNLELQPSIIGQTDHSVWWNDPYNPHGQLVMDQNYGIFLNAGNDGTHGYGSLVVGPERNVPGEVFAELIGVATAGKAANTYGCGILANGMIVSDNNGAGHGQIFFGSFGDDTHTSVQGASFFVNVPTEFPASAGQVRIDSPVVLSLDPGAQIKFGSGAQGKYYHEEISTASSSYAAGSVLPVLAAGLAQATIHSDYGAGGQFSSGAGGALTFTAPEDGAYLLNIGCGGIGTTLGAATRFELNIVGGRGNDCASFNGVVYTDDVLWLAKNVTVTFQFFQNSGAARNAPFTVRAHRLV